MSYVIAINHNRGVSYWISYEKNFGSLVLAKRYGDKQLAEACLNNISCYLVQELLEETMYSYLGYDVASLHAVELNDD